MPSFLRRTIGVLRLVIGSIGLAIFGRVKPHRWVPPALSLRLLRLYLEPGSAAVAASMRAQLPAGGRRVRSDLVYDPQAGRDGLFDLVMPERSDVRPPLIVWMHGGGWYYGQKSDPLPYLELLATHGFAAASLNYPRIPEIRHPAAPRAAHRAVEHLRAHADEYGFDPDRIILGGDSAGAQVAAAAALAWTSPAYASAIGVTGTPPLGALRGTVLFCGTFDAPALLEAGRMFTAILASSMWAQAGTKDWLGTETADLITIRKHLTPDFPPTFLRSGNADPLTAGGSVPMARTLTELGIDLDYAILGDEESPAPHQVQFQLGTPYGDEIARDLVSFLTRVG